MSVVSAGSSRSAASSSSTSSSASASPLVIWCNLQLDGALRERLEEGTSAHRLLWARHLSANNNPVASPDPALTQQPVDVAFGQPQPGQCAAMPALRWVHLSTAGYTPFDTDPVRTALRERGAALTTSSTVYAEPCAQHVLALLLAHGRQLPAAILNQHTKRGWPKNTLRASSTMLRGQQILLVGFGSIARRLVQLLAPFEAQVKAVRRTPRGDEPVPTFSEAELERLLAEADHVIDLLPGSTQTTGLFSAARLAACKQGAVFYNIGRGTTVDQDALAAVLQRGHLTAAYLDVTEPEPLPSEHPLWSNPRCVITPHTAGGHVDEPERLVEHFLTNLRRHEQGQALLDRVI